MTFSLVGRCAKTGMFGVAITTSSIAVASRCPWARAKVGAVATQNVTDPRLGNQGLDLLARGVSAPDAMKALMAAAPHAEHRQVTMIDAQGRTAHWSGAKTLGTNNVAAGENCVAAGNLLQNADVPAAMVRAFAGAKGHLAARLLAGLEAGIVAGGEMGPVHSAGLLVVDEQPWPLVDLRVDWHDENPIGALKHLWQDYEPQMAAYITRALNPDAAPSYGVPGDMDDRK
ncbi:putative Ntn-hydrolase superfamily protein [Dongia mobilis]|uniref:Putative Ntn-hydrolase superfamily protein n=1 Tax=Dongia mobilis TaxID=578943 RepID=A0A4R6WL04_9PROT|nr:DUF1028 domain-containing protein [Dongia mobilis]TDQ81382.1 putative Ntn-hydrolase superfamily protein [Dongia mobilis]